VPAAKKNGDDDLQAGGQGASRGEQCVDSDGRNNRRGVQAPGSAALDLPLPTIAPAAS